MDAAGWKSEGGDEKPLTRREGGVAPAEATGAPVSSYLRLFSDREANWESSAIEILLAESVGKRNRDRNW